MATVEADAAICVQDIDVQCVLDHDVKPVNLAVLVLNDPRCKKTAI